VSDTLAYFSPTAITRSCACAHPRVKKERKKKKAEEKKRLSLEKKEMRLKKKEEKEILKKMKKEIKPSNNTKNPKDKKVKKRKAKPTDQELATYICEKCCKQYDDDLNDEEWVECDYCDKWFHVKCTDLPVLDALDENVDFTCQTCQDDGFPSHN
jgi:flagellar biosynthesis GTPase FlhF